MSKRTYATVLAAILFVGNTASAAGVSIHQEAARGKVAEVDRLLRSKPSLVGKTNRLRQTPLHCAAAAGQTAVVRSLLTHGATLEARDCDGFTPLIVAAENGRVDIVRLLLAKRADVNARSPIGGDTPLHRAALNGNVEVVRMLLAHGAKVNVRAWMPSGMPRGGRMLAPTRAKNGAPLEVTPLDIAIACKHKAVADLLKKHGGRSALPSVSDRKSTGR
jgi:ankyrin repeat protein